MIINQKLFYEKLKLFLKWKIITSNNDRIIKITQSYKKINNTIKNLNSKFKMKRNTSNDLDYFISTKINTTRDKTKYVFNKSTKSKSKNISSYQNESTTKKYNSTKESIIPYGKNNKNIKEKYSSISLREQQDLKECTFIPKINEYSKIKRNSYNMDLKDESDTNRVFEIFNKLYNDNLIYKNKIKYNQEKC